jgi:AdoMet-dependent heme synthase
MSWNTLIHGAHKIRAGVYSKFGVKVPHLIIHKCTFRCNLRCKYCGRWEYSKHEMDTPTVYRAMKEFYAAGTRSWLFTGGEPLLREDIGDLIGYVRDFGFTTVLDTNGTLLEEKIDEIDELKRCGVLNISLDGPKETHDALRGSGTYDKVIAAVKMAKSSGFTVHLNSVICKENTKDGAKGIIGLLELVKSVNRPIYFQPIYESKYNSQEASLLIPEEKEYKRALDIIRRFRQDNYALSDPSEMTLNWFEDYFKKTNDWDCLAGRTYAVLFPEGTVAPCFFKEESGINGERNGFVNAFNMLPRAEPHCKCMMSCYAEYNFMYSLNRKELFSQLHKRVFETLP